MFVSLCSALFLVHSSLNLVPVRSAPLLIISLDGFRHDYLSEHQLPHLTRFMNQGVRTKNGMKPTYITNTFPNHISIATGMYEEEHGVIYNSFFDKLLNKTINMGSRDEGQWSDPRVEPIWITATRQNKKSAVLFWPACHNEFHGVRPLIYSWSYTDGIPLREKINNGIRYFKELQLDLVLLYHYEPDKQGHDYGPQSPEMAQTLQRLDGEIGYLMDQVKNELNDNLNIMIVSDHGMTNVTKVIRPFPEGYVRENALQGETLAGAMFSVTPRAEFFAEVKQNLSKIPNVKVYERKDLPERLHYSKAGHRLGDIIVIPDIEGNVFSSGKTLNSAYTLRGNHGWDNDLKSMQSIFMARGPDFDEQREIDSLKNVDVYHIASKLLQINPNPNATAGSLENLGEIFRQGTETSVQSTDSVSSQSTGSSSAQSTDSVSSQSTGSVFSQSTGSSSVQSTNSVSSQSTGSSAGSTTVTTTSTENNAPVQQTSITELLIGLSVLFFML